jgi:MoaA/NifB/PqqE/SkfB family radical SAM enzyme
VAFDRSVERELERIDPIGRPTALQTAIVAITRRCSLGCEHCFEGDALNQPEALSADDLHEIVRRLQQRGVAQIFFSGGEPLQRFDDLLALAAAVSAGTDVWILTSGRGLTADKARQLSDAGVTGVALSLDHWDASAHDRFRGAPGSFDGVERASGQARAAGLLVALSLCPTRAFVTAENLQRYGETARSLGASFIQILEPRALGRYADCDVALEPAQQRLLEAFSDRLNTDDTDVGLPSVRYQDWSARSVGCSGAGDRYLYIDTEGDMHACPFCRAPGVRVLDHAINAAISMLQAAGCQAGASHCHPAARTTS